VDKCLFCDRDLAPGSLEHVFLSALGAHIATRRATCQPCNNAFATGETGKIDDALAEGFEEIRNGLKIWTGRNKPPPTLLRAGLLDNGAEFDLAPGFIPVVRPGRVPATLASCSQYTLVAASEADAKRQMDILSKRGISVEAGTAVRVEQKAPTIKRSVRFDGPKVWRAVAKTAAVAFAVLYGNEQARRSISGEVRKAIRYGVPSISDFAGWDFFNDWPSISSSSPHENTPDAKLSGFEHSVIIGDVNERSVAYVTLFGGWRLSIDLGERTTLPARGLATNPRAAKPARFVLTVNAPATYAPRNADSFSTEHNKILEGNNKAFSRALQTWSEEARASYAEQLAGELAVSVQAAGEDEAKRSAAIATFAQKLAAIEYGDGWSTDLGAVFDEDTSATVPEGT
jgi:hypothetical protein